MKKISMLALAIVALSFNAFADHTPEHQVTNAVKKVEQKTTEVKASVEQKATEAKTEMKMPEGTIEDHMAQAMKLGAPSDAHKKLDAFAGQWTFTAKFWMEPKQKKPEVSKGTNDNTWILGGRFLQTKTAGEATKAWPAFEGVGFVGYDNAKQQYTTTWMNNMSTGTESATATFDDKTKTLNVAGVYNCAMEKCEKKYRAVWKIKGKDAYSYTTYMNDKNNKEFKTMEIEYKRAK